MMCIAWLAFYVGTMIGGWNTQNPVVTQSENAQTAATGTVAAADITVTVIDDVRCSDCQTDGIVSQLQSLPFLQGATFETKEFTNDDMASYLEDNSITALPAILFSTNQIADGGQITPYLQAIPDGSFSLAVGAAFDPFATRSERWFLMTTEDVLSSLQENAYYEWSENAKITWIEYTDVNCHYCKKMASDKTAEAVLEKFPESVNKDTVNFIGVGWANTQNAAEALECIASLGWSQAYNTAMKGTLLSWDSSVSAITALGVEAGVPSTSIESCIENGDVKDLVADKFSRWREVFGITGTPGNVIINNETGEYEVVSGAYPAETFISVIERMLAE